MRRRCIICHFEVEQDDELVGHDGERTLCLRCFARETDSAKPLSKALRRSIEAALSAAEAN